MCKRLLISLAAAYCNHTCAAQFGSLGEGIAEMQAKPILDESLAKHGGSSTYTDRLPFNGEIRTTVVSVIVPVWNSATLLQASKIGISSFWESLCKYV